MAKHSYIHDVFVLFDSKGLFLFLSSVHVRIFQTCTTTPYGFHGIYPDGGSGKSKKQKLIRFFVDPFGEISISLQYFHVRNVEFGYLLRNSSIWSYEYWSILKFSFEDFWRSQWPETSFQSIPFASHVKALQAQQVWISVIALNFHQNP